MSRSLDGEELEVDEMIVYTPVGCPALNVRLADDTIWLTMQQLAMVFGVDRSVIGKHIRNVYKTGELDREATWAKIAQVQIEGGRQVKRTLEYYNLDVVISVGYRVNSKRATQFRIWATNVIKTYLLRGKVENRELDDMKKHLANHEKRLSRMEQGVENNPDAIAATRSTSPPDRIWWRWRYTGKTVWEEIERRVFARTGGVKSPYRGAAEPLE